MEDLDKRYFRAEKEGYLSRVAIFFPVPGLRQASQAGFAEKLGIRQNMVSDYERGKRRLSPAGVKRILRGRKSGMEKTLDFRKIIF